MEKSQCDRKALTIEDDIADKSIKRVLKHGPKPPPHTEKPSFLTDPPPRNPYSEEEEDYTDNCFNPHVCLDFSTFNGKDDPLRRINRCETFFKGQNTPKRYRVWYVVMHLTGSAQMWYYRLELIAGTPSWCCFTQLVQ